MRNNHLCCPMMGEVSLERSLIKDTRFFLENNLICLLLKETIAISFKLLHTYQKKAVFLGDQF